LSRRKEQDRMAAPASPHVSIDTAPDVRGPTAPLPASIFGLGIAALILVFGGTIALQLVWAVSGGSITAECRTAGLTQFVPQSPAGPAHGIIGAKGVCNIVTALTSPAQTVVLVVGFLLGIAAIVLGFAWFKRMDTKRKREECITGAVLGIQAVALAGLLQWFRSGTPEKFAQQFLNFDLLHGSVNGFLTGAKNTLLLAFAGEVGGIVIGVILALLVVSRRRAVRAPARVYINFFRGTPLIWQLSVFYFGFLLGLQIRMSAFVAAAIVFMLNTGAYAAEVFRAGIQSIERGQLEAARSLGMTYAQAMRYAIVPQAVRRVIPPLMNEFVILIKDTSLIIVLGLLASELDLYNFARSGYSEFFNATFFVGAAIGYLTVTLPLIGLVNALERRLRSGLVGVGAQGM
jgi:His/Glu/Gln/Arg/opine family amino acid ABC transporter permease subunit